MRSLTFTVLLAIIIALIPSDLIGQDDLGTVKFETSCIPEVKADFERGLALLHHMMYEQAEGVFKGVAAEDPSCAMAYWGMAMTQLHPLWAPPTDQAIRKGQDAVREARAREAPTRREQAYIEAIAAYFENASERPHQERLSTWEEAQKKVYEAYPNDVDAGAFFALSHLATAPPEDKEFTHHRRAGAMLEELRAEHPEHPGLFHYTIHAYDNPALAERAVEVARGYDDIAPSVPHALHMPSHIFVRLGMWEEAIEWNIRSADAALDQPVAGKTSMHHAHALDYLMYAYLQRGQDQKAEELVNEIRAVEPYQDHFAAAYSMAAVPARYVLERGAWAEAARLPVRTHDAFAWEKYPQYEAITYFARGLGAARSDDLDAAREAIGTLDDLYEQTVEAGEDYWAVQVDVKRTTISAWIAYAEGRPDEAVRRMREAANLEDSVDKHPVTPGAVRPARELLADMLVRYERPADAIEAYQAVLELSPNRLHSLYGMGRAAEIAGKHEMARKAYAEVTELTKAADTEREEIVRAKAFLAGD